MSERTENKDIEIKDLSPEETLTAEEKELLAGAGRFRPTFDALEARELLAANLMAPVAPVVLAETMVMPAEPIMRIEMPAEVMYSPTASVEAAPATTVQTPAADTSTEQADIRQKLEQIRQVETILQGMDVPNLPYAQWLEGQAQKNQALIAADQAELKLK